MGKLSNFLQNVPGGKTALAFYPYYLEFKAIEPFKEENAFSDRETLGAEIRRTAHILEKDFKAFDFPRFFHFEKRLGQMLEEWEKRGYGEDATVDWAGKILATHKKMERKKK